MRLAMGAASAGHPRYFNWWTNRSAGGSMRQAERARVSSSGQLAHSAHASSRDRPVARSDAPHLAQHGEGMARSTALQRRQTRRDVSCGWMMPSHPRQTGGSSRSVTALRKGRSLMRARCAALRDTTMAGCAVTHVRPVSLPGLPCASRSRARAGRTSARTMPRPARSASRCRRARGSPTPSPFVRAACHPRRTPCP